MDYESKLTFVVTQKRINLRLSSGTDFLEEYFNDMGKTCDRGGRSVLDQFNEGRSGQASRTRLMEPLIIFLLQVHINNYLQGVQVVYLLVLVTV